MGSGPHPFRYTVAAEFSDPAIAEEWIAWLRDGHLADVLEGGAVAAEVVVDEPPTPPAGTARPAPVRCEARYVFPSREAFEAYERDHAPRLRGEGIAKFPPERGIRYSRRTGVVAAGTAVTAATPRRA